MNEGKGSHLHQVVQEYVFNLLPRGEAFIEYRLPGHIADICWLPKKIVFEIQVSPISIDIAVKRTEDYRKMGFHIVWILHQKSFNGPYLTLAELYLRRQRTSYFTNISRAGIGYIYDQNEKYRNNKRELRGEPLILDLKSPLISRGNLFFLGDRNDISVISILTKSLQLWYSKIQKFF